MCGTCLKRITLVNKISLFRHNEMQPPVSLAFPTNECYDLSKTCSALANINHSPALCRSKKWSTPYVMNFLTISVLNAASGSITMTILFTSWTASNMYIMIFTHAVKKRSPSFLPFNPLTGTSCCFSLLSHSLSFFQRSNEQLLSSVHYLFPIHNALSDSVFHIVHIHGLSFSLSPFFILFFLLSASPASYH